MAWTNLDLDDLETLAEELEEFNNNKHGSNDKRNTGANLKSTGKESDDGKDTRSKVQTNSKGNEDEDDEQDEDETLELDEENEDDEEIENSARKGKQAEGDGDTAADGNLVKNLQREIDEARRAMADLARDRDSAREEALKSRKNESTLRKGSLKSEKDSIEGRLKNIKAAIKQAKESGDIDAEIDLLAEQQETTLRRMALESALEDADAEVVEAPVRQTQAAPQLDPNTPKEAVAFVQRNAWIASAPADVRTLVASQAQILIDAGNNPADVTFYDKLEKRLGAVFEGTNYKINPRVKPTEAKKAPVKSKGSPVSGRETSSNSTNPTMRVERGEDGKTRVKISKADIAYAKSLGFETPDEIKKYVREKVKIEKETGGNAGNWSTIQT